MKTHFVMMHQQIESEEIIERYVRNRLEPEQRKAFEEHYFSCNECFEKLQAAERFVAGIRDAARRGELEETSADTGPWWRIVPAWASAFGVAVLLFALVGSSWQYLQMLRLRDQLSQSSTELRNQRAARAELEQQLERVLHAETNVPLVMLQSTRDTQSVPTEVPLPAAASRLVLWIEVSPGRGSSYRLELYASDGKPVETLEHLTRNSYGALAASLPAERLQPGDFRIKLFAEAPPPATELAEYSLRIRRP